MPSFVVHLHNLSNGRTVDRPTIGPDVLRAWEGLMSKGELPICDSWGTIEQKANLGKTEMAWEFVFNKGHLRLTPYQGYSDKMVGHCSRCLQFGSVTKEDEGAAASAELAPKIALCVQCKAKDPFLMEAK